MANPTVVVVGRLVEDPEVRAMQNGNLVKFRLITSDRVQVSPGEWADKDTSGWNVEAWSKLADASKSVLKKGMGVVVTGTIKERSYEKDGQKRYITEIRANEIAVNVFSVDKIKSPATVKDSYNSADIWGEDISTAKVPF